MIINRSTGDLSTPVWIAIALTVVGALNWGLYVVVALSGLFLLFAASQFKRESRGTVPDQPLPRRTAT